MRNGGRLKDIDKIVERNIIPSIQPRPSKGESRKKERTPKEFMGQCAIQFGIKGGISDEEK